MVDKTQKTKKGKPSARPPVFRLILYAAFFIVIVATVLTFSQGGSRNPARLLSDIASFFSGSSEKFGRVSFDSDNTNIFAEYAGGLAVLNKSRLALFDASGAETFSLSSLMDSPTLDSAGGKLLAYNRGGSLFLTDSSGVLFESAGPIYDARLNRRGWLVTVTREQSYSGVATVYDDKLGVRFYWNSARHYILSAALSPDCKTLAVASAIQEGEELKSRVTIHSLSKPGDPESELEVNGQLILRLIYPDNNHICAMTESGALFLSREGETLGEFSAGGGELTDYAYSDEFLLLRRKFTSSRGESELLLFDYDGARLSQLALDSEIKSLSAGGGFFSVLTDRSLNVYSKDGEMTSSTSDCAGVRQALQRPDGSAILISGDSAVLYEPASG